MFYIRLIPFLVGIVLIIVSPPLYYAQVPDPLVQDQSRIETATDASIWIIDDADKVNPVSGNLLSEGLDVYTGKKQSRQEYRVHNNVWDAKSDKIMLFAGRNEFVSFQIVMEKRRDDVQDVFIYPTDLCGSIERISADKNVRLFKQLCIKVEDVWYPDALLPFELAGTTPFDLPDYNGPITDQRIQAVWVDIYVPHHLPPDIYRGKLFILHSKTKKQAILDVELEVSNFTLPDKLSIDFDLMNYGYMNIEQGWPDVVLNSERHLIIEREFYREAHRHRMTFNIMADHFRDGSIPMGYKPELAGVGDKIHVSDWSKWDKHFGPVLSGDAFADLPRASQPVTHFFLPHNLNWPSSMLNWGKPDYRIEYFRISEDFKKHLTERGWTEPQYQIYYNHKKKTGWYPWNLDEPTSMEDLKALRYLGEIFHECFKNDEKLNVAFRIDIGHYLCENVAECKVNYESSREVDRIIGPLVDLWNIGHRHLRNNLQAVGKLKSQGKTVYFYCGAPEIQLQMTVSISLPWLGYKYGVDGICFWSAVLWADDPYTDADGRSGSRQGFDMIFYPGSRFDYDGPVTSMRAKALRRGLQDYEYLRLIEKSRKMSSEEIIKLSEGLLLANKQNRLDDILPGWKDLLTRTTDYAKLRRTIFDKLTSSISGKGE